MHQPCPAGELRVRGPAGRAGGGSRASSAVHDIRAAREHGILDALAEAGIRCWADKGYQGAGGTVRVPYRGRWAKLSAGQQKVNRAHAKIRALGEQAMATLKTWRISRKLRCGTTRVTSLVKAIPSLHLTCPNEGCKPRRSAGGPGTARLRGEADELDSAQFFHEDIFGPQFTGPPGWLLQRPRCTACPRGPG
ncbi:transposase family protein [Streptomyces flavidovirens]|uniref:transposase family protein n=1 Tax=Streptomyces flavidovirens TaxID=67298 RepID=UPI00344AB3FD